MRATFLIVVALIVIGLSSVGVVVAWEQLIRRSGDPSTPAPPGESPSPGPPDSPGAEPILITGNERLSWDYVANTNEELSRLQFLVRVDDDEAVGLDDVRCESAGEDWRFTCSARLPSLAPGDHTIAVRALGSDGSEQLLGDLSAAILVHLQGGTALAPAGRAGTALGSMARTSPAARSAAGSVIGLVETEPGAWLVAEREGRIRMFHEGAPQPAVALTVDDVDVGHGGVLAMAADSDFSAHRFVYVLYTTVSGVRLARFTLSGDSLVSRAILLEGLPRTDPASAALTAAPDGSLYVALGGGAEPPRNADTLLGKLLRVSRDGTTPPDQPAGLPVVAEGLQRPVGLAWTREGLWVADLAANDATRLRLVVPRTPYRMDVSAGFTIPLEVAATASLVDGQDAAARHDDLVLKTARGQLMVVHVAGTGRRSPSMAWISSAGSAVMAIAAGRDGALRAFTGVKVTTLRVETGAP